MRLTNNKVAVLAILLMLISLICNTMLYQKTGIYITGKATAQGYVAICINHPPVLNEFASNLTVKEGGLFVYDVNATDKNNATQSLTFHDNTSLFNISSETGIINFTAPGSSAGIYDILITAQDNSSCVNNNATKTLVLNITMDNVAPSITSYYPLGNPTITEEQIRLFNISYEDEDGDTLAVYWYLDNSLVSTFNDISDTLKSNYTFIGNYTNAGTYNAIVVVSDSLLNDSHSWILTVTDVNRPPSFIRTIKNQTWAEDSTLYGLDLDDYSYDPDTEDTLSYSTNYLTNPHSITVAINDENVVTFSQPADWYGAENISFTVTDNHGASNTSNNVTLTVYNVPETDITIGQAASQAPGRTTECIEFWFCSYWSICYEDGFMERTCTDLSYCGTEYYKPEEIKDCKYIPSCFNKIQDGDETEIDCGGKCGPCPSCFDGAMNNDETGIDCGGTCPPCPTCFDSIINGGEIGVDCGGACELQDCCTNGYRDAHLGEKGIDCGGPCKECAVDIEKPAPKRLLIAISMIILIIIILLSVIAYRKREELKLFSLSIIKRSKKRELVRSTGKRGNILQKIDRLEREIESRPAEEALKEFLIILRVVLIGLFGLKYEFTYKNLIPLIKKSKIKPIIKSLLIEFIKRIIHIAYSGYNIRKEEIMLLTKEFRVIIHLITRAKKDEKEGKRKNIREKKEYEKSLDGLCMALSRSLFTLENLEIEETKKLYAKSKEIYKQLSQEEKKEADNYMERIEKEIKLFEKRIERKKRKKDVAFIVVSLIVLMFLGSMDIYQGSNITGLSVFEENIPEENNAQPLIYINGFNIEVGTNFVYRITGYDQEDETLSLYDDTKLFNINSNGVIDFTPTKDQLGVHHVTIIIKDSNYNTLFKDVIFNITRSGGIEYIIEKSSDLSQTQQDTREEKTETTQIQQETIEEIIEETQTQEDIINTTQQSNQTKELNETTKLLNISSNQEQNISKTENITSQLEEFPLKPSDIYVIEQELEENSKFSLVAENQGTREIENSYFKILIEDKNGSIIADIQSTPINITKGEKKEMTAYWNPENIAIGNYTGKLMMMYEDKSSEYDIVMSITSGEKTKIIGITGMVTAPSAIIKTQSYTNIPPILIWIILLIISIDIAWFLLKK